MTVFGIPAVQPRNRKFTSSEPINLFRLGCLFVIRASYWSCWAGNDPDDLELSQDRIDAKAIASFGTKDLLDPAKTQPSSLVTGRTAPFGGAARAADERDPRFRRRRFLVLKIT